MNTGYHPFGSLASDTFEIVGVVADTAGAFIREVRPEAYIPFTLSGPANFGVVVRPRALDPGNLVSTLRAEVAAIDKDQPVMDAEPVDRFIARLSRRDRSSMLCFSGFSACLAWRWSRLASMD